MILFIVNPISGHGNKRKVVSRLSQKDCRVVYTEYAGHAEQLARDAVEDIVVAVGGDGTRLESFLKEAETDLHYTLD